MAKVKDAIEAIAEREFDAKTNNSNGFLGISVGSFVGGVIGFSIGKLQNYNQDMQMLIVVTGILVGGCISKIIGNVDSKKISKDIYSSSKLIIKDLVKNDAVVSLKKDLSNKMVKRASDELLKLSNNPAIVITAFSGVFDPLINNIASISSSVDVTGAIGWSKASFGAAGQMIYASAPLIIEVAAVSATVAVLGYMAYNYVKKEQKNIELKYQTLEAEEKKLEENYRKLNMDIYSIANEDQKKALTKSSSEFYREYYDGYITSATVGNMGNLHNNILQGKDKSIAIRIQKLSDNVIKSIDKCNKLFKQEKSFVEKTMIFFDRSR